MAISTSVVKKPKVNGVYQVSNVYLGTGKHSRAHNVIIASINKKNNTAKVRTITSAEYYKMDESGNIIYNFANNKLDLVKNGDIIIIPKKHFKTKYLSGVYKKTIEVPLNKIHYKEPKDKTIFPTIYKKVIRKK